MVKDDLKERKRFRNNESMFDYQTMSQVAYRGRKIKKEIRDE